MAGLFDKTGGQDTGGYGSYGLFGTNTAGQAALFPELNQTPEFKMPEWKRKQLEADRALRALGLTGQELEDTKLDLFAPDVIGQRRKAIDEEKSRAEWDRRQKVAAEEADRQRIANDELFRRRQEEDDIRSGMMQADAQRARESLFRTQQQAEEMERQKKIASYSSRITPGGEILDHWEPGTVQTSNDELHPQWKRLPHADQSVLEALSMLGVPIEGQITTTQAIMKERDQAYAKAEEDRRNFREQREAVENAARATREAAKKQKQDAATKAYQGWVEADAAMNAPIDLSDDEDIKKEKSKRTLENAKAEAVYKAHSGETAARKALKDVEGLDSAFGMTEATPRAKEAKAKKIIQDLRDKGWSPDRIKRSAELMDYLDYLSGQ